MSNLFKKPTVDIPNHHNGFDMSMRRLFTMPPGMLLPVYCDLLNPNDKGTVNVNAMVRTESVDTAAFQNFKLHFDWFLVPIRQEYQFWSEFYNGVFDANTNFVQTSNKFSLPFANFNINTSNFVGDISSPNTSWFGYYGEDGTTFSENSDEMGVPYIHNFYRLADLLGLSKMQDVPIFPYKHLAYHKIFYSHYFRGDWTERDTELFNVDSQHGDNIGKFRFDRITSVIHYRPYRYDYFTSVMPSPVFNASFASIVGDSFLQGSPQDSFSPLEDPSGNKVRNDLVRPGSRAYPNLQLDTSDLRLTNVGLQALFNYDKLVRITSLAGSHYTNQMRQHFGVHINNDIHNEAEFLGSQTVDISIAEVVATASTGADDQGASLGDIAGKGFGMSHNSKPLRYSTKEHAVLMCVASIEPIQMYSSQCVERNNLYRLPFDFYRPELDNLGMQPQFSDELGVNFGASSGLLGYQYRYSELKTKYDIVNEGFLYGRKRSWQCNYQQSISNDVANHIKHFYINPQYANNIFLQSFPTYRPQELIKNWDTSFNDSSDETGFNSKSTIYHADNFMVNAFFDVKKASIMSVHSLPKLI